MMHKDQTTTRVLGKAPYVLIVPPIGLGCMGLSITKQNTGNKPTRINQEDAVEFLVQAWKLGVRLFDTADIYGNTDKQHGLGHNELLLGQALTRLKRLPEFKREEVVISTKVGIDLSWGLKINNSPEYLRSAVSKSIERLGGEPIDLLYLHCIDSVNFKFRETIQALKSLVDEKKIRCIGLSRATPELLEEAHEIHPLTAVEFEYSPWIKDQNTEKMIEICTKHYIGMVICTPLGRGFFNENYNQSFFKNLPSKDFRSIFPRLTQFLDQNLGQRKSLEDMAKHLNCGLSQLVLAWLLAKNSLFVPIPGTTNLVHLKDNLAAAKLAIDPELMSKLDQLIEQSHYQGNNEPELSDAFEKMTGTCYFYSNK